VQLPSVGAIRLRRSGRPIPRQAHRGQTWGPTIAAAATIAPNTGSWCAAPPRSPSAASAISCMRTSRSSSRSARCTGSPIRDGLFWKSSKCRPAAISARKTSCGSMMLTIRFDRAHPAFLAHWQVVVADYRCAPDLSLTSHGGTTASSSRPRISSMRAVRPPVERSTHARLADRVSTKRGSPEGWSWSGPRFRPSKRRESRAPRCGRTQPVAWNDRNH
jgi:hypothetical protein